MPECPEHGGDLFACPPCQREPAGKKLAPKLTSEMSREGMTIEARFRSQCPRCHRVIQIGDRITSTVDGWVCEGICALEA